MLLGLVIAGQIAAYTRRCEGIEHANPVPYLLLALVPTAIGAALVSGRERLRAEWRLRAVLAGCGGFLAYVLVLAALRLAPAAPVAAVRETSVLFAVARPRRSSASGSRRSGCRAPCSSSAVSSRWARRSPRMGRTA